MPAEPASPAPAAVPAAAPAAAPAVSSPPQPQRREINVSQIPPPATPEAPPKKGSAREKMIDNLRHRAKPEPGTSPEPELSSATPAAGDESDVAPEGDEPAAPAGEPKPGDKKKVNPWKLVDEYKARVKEYEGKIAEVEKRAVPEAKWKEVNETLTKRETRLKELEDEIRYVNFSKSEEFKQKFEAPYAAAWTRAMSELKDLTVEGPDGNTRALEPKDILELVNLPLPAARALAEEKYGALANDVMAHRKEIRNLADAQFTALEEARTKGAEREKLAAEQRQKDVEGISVKLKEQWTKTNESILSHEKYGVFFKPVDGDEQGNQRLAKGFELADRAFSENPLMPGLTAEQRTAIIERHAAVRNRAAAFGRLVYMNQQRDAQIADLKKQLAEYTGAEPPADGGTRTPSAPTKPGGMAGIVADLHKLAK